MNEIIKQSTLTSIESMIAMFDNLDSGAQFLNNDNCGENWWEDNKLYVNELQSWINIVKSILANTGRLDVINQWVQASDYDITVLNVHNYASRMKALLESIVGAIKSDVGLGINDSNFTYDVFLSYSSTNSKEAKDIQDLIEKAGGIVFIDKKCIPPGEDFSETVRVALTRSNELWMLVSADSIKSEWVRTEWAAAWVLKISIVPILLDCVYTSLPSQLQHLQAVQYQSTNILIRNRFK